MQTLVQSRNSLSYDHDLVEWIDAQIHLLLEKRFSELDIESLVEELDGMKKHYTRELHSRLTVIELHLLKCQHQSNHPQNKWRSTIIEQRDQLSKLFGESPSLRRHLPDYASDCYPVARRRAAAETGLDISQFPHDLPYSVAQILDQEFMPSP